MMDFRYPGGWVPGGLDISSGLDNGCQVVWVSESFKVVIRSLFGGLIYIGIDAGMESSKVCVQAS